MDHLHPKIRGMFQVLSDHDELASAECKKAIQELPKVESCQKMMMGIMQDHDFQTMTPYEKATMVLTKFCEGDCRHDLENAARDTIDACFDHIPDGRHVDTDPYKMLIVGSLEMACVQHEDEYCTAMVARDFPEIQSKYGHHTQYEQTVPMDGQGHQEWSHQSSEVDVTPPNLDLMIAYGSHPCVPLMLRTFGASTKRHFKIAFIATTSVLSVLLVGAIVGLVVLYRRTRDTSMSHHQLL